jgi:hypothetical protein
MQTFIIPTSAQAQIFTIQLAGVTYNMRLTYHTVDGGLEGVAPSGYDSDSDQVIDLNNLSNWTLDIFDVGNNPIVCGMPLIPGIDLLYQYQYLKLGGALIVSSPPDFDRVPSFTDLGTVSQLYFVVLP